LKRALDYSASPITPRLAPLKSILAKLEPPESPFTLQGDGLVEGAERAYQGSMTGITRACDKAS
jgi:hypothetical protein